MISGYDIRENTLTQNSVFLLLLKADEEGCQDVLKDLSAFCNLIDAKVKGFDYVFELSGISDDSMLEKLRVKMDSLSANVVNPSAEETKKEKEKTASSFIKPSLSDTVENMSLEKNKEGFSFSKPKEVQEEEITSLELSGPSLSLAKDYGNISEQEKQEQEKNPVEEENKTVVSFSKEEMKDVSVQIETKKSLFGGFFGKIKETLKSQKMKKSKEKGIKTLQEQGSNLLKKAKEMKGKVSSSNLLKQAQDFKEKVVSSELMQQAKSLKNDIEQEINKNEEKPKLKEEQNPFKDLGSGIIVKKSILNNVDTSEIIDKEKKELNNNPIEAKIQVEDIFEAQTVCSFYANPKDENLGEFSVFKEKSSPLSMLEKPFGNDDNKKDNTALQEDIEDVFKEKEEQVKEEEIKEVKEETKEEISEILPAKGPTKGQNSLEEKKEEKDLKENRNKNILQAKTAEKQKFEKDKENLEREKTEEFNQEIKHIQNSEPKTETEPMDLSSLLKTEQAEESLPEEKEGISNQLNVLTVKTFLKNREKLFHTEKEREKTKIQKESMPVISKGDKESSEFSQLLKERKEEKETVSTEKEMSNEMKVLTLGTFFKGKTNKEKKASEKNIQQSKLEEKEGKNSLQILKENHKLEEKEKAKPPLTKNKEELKPVQQKENNFKEKEVQKNEDKKKEPKFMQDNIEEKVQKQTIFNKESKPFHYVGKIISQKNYGNIDHTLHISAPSQGVKYRSYPIEMPLIPTYTFANMDNSPIRFAHAMGMSTLENLGVGNNPFLLQGESGTGKTHFLHAMGYEISKKIPQSKILFTNGVRFSRGIQGLLERGKKDKLDEFFNNAEVLIIDDIHLTAVNEHNREYISGILNDFWKNKKQILLSSKYPPESLKRFEELVDFKLSMGAVAELKVPNKVHFERLTNKMVSNAALHLNENQIKEFFVNRNNSLGDVAKDIKRVKVLSRRIESSGIKNLSYEEILKNMTGVRGENENSEISKKGFEDITSLQKVKNYSWGNFGFFFPASQIDKFRWVAFASQEAAKDLGIRGGFNFALKSAYSTEHIISAAFKIANICDLKGLKGAVILGPSLMECKEPIRENFYDILTHMLEVMMIRCGTVNFEDIQKPSAYVKMLGDILR